MKSQSAIEFLTTYSWAFLILGIFVVSVLAVVSLPSKSSVTYQPQTCYISPSFPCSEALMATNSIGTTFLVIFQNSLGTGIYFPQNVLTTYNGIVLSPSLTSNVTYGGVCYPQNAIAGSTVTCTATMAGYNVPTASQVNPEFTVSYQICTPTCTKQVYNTSGTAVTVVEPYKSLIYVVQLLTTPAGSIALNGVKYPNGANVIFVSGASYNLYGVPFGTNTFTSWTAGGGAMVVSTSSQSTTANAISAGTITATFS